MFSPWYMGQNGQQVPMMPQGQPGPAPGMGGGPLPVVPGAGPQGLGAMPGPMAPPMAGPMAGPIPDQMAPGDPAQMSWADKFSARAQSPGLQALLGAGMGMLGAAKQKGGLGEALLAGTQGGLGGFAGAQLAQREAEKDQMMRRLLEAQLGVVDQSGSGAMPPARRQPPQRMGALGDAGAAPSPTTPGLY